MPEDRWERWRDRNVEERTKRGMGCVGKGRRYWPCPLIRVRKVVQPPRRGRSVPLDSNPHCHYVAIGRVKCGTIHEVGTIVNPALVAPNAARLVPWQW